MRVVLFVCLTACFAYPVHAQMSVDQALTRLRQRQAERDKAERAKESRANATSRPQTQPTTQPPEPDAAHEIDAFAETMDAMLVSGNRDQAKTDAAFARLLGHRFRLDCTADGVTNKVPIGDTGLFGDRPNTAIAVSLGVSASDDARTLPERQGANSGNEPPVPHAEIYLSAPDDFIGAIVKGDKIRGHVTLSRAEVEPIEWKAGNSRTIFAGRITLLGVFAPDPVHRSDEKPPIIATIPADPLAPIMRAAPVSGATSLGSARRVVFVCDASGSMLNKFSTVRRELSRAVNQLRPDQAFGIIFFQDQVKDGYTALSQSLRMATPENKLRVDAYLGTIIPRGSTNPIPGLRQAFLEHPDTVYLLTDGDFPNNRAVLDEIRDLDRDRHVRINTIAFVSDADTDTEFMAVLKRIAQETGGVYRYVRESDL